MEIVQATVAGDICIFGLRPKCIERLRYALRISNPEYDKRKMLHLSTSDVPEYFYCIVERPDGSVTVPRGSVKLVKSTLAKDNTDLKFTDLRRPGLPIYVGGQPSLRPYQEVGLSAMTIGLQGTIIIPCGGGKTRLGVAAIGRLALKAIVFVHTEDLLNQWIVDLRDHLKIEPGTIKDGVFTDGPVVVAMILTTINLLSKSPDLLNDFGVCIADECHRVPSETYQILLPHVSARYRFGLTATPDREDGRGRLIEWSCGDRLYEISTKELANLGFLLMPTLDVIETKFEFNSITENKLVRMTELTRTLVKDKARNQLIVDRVVEEARAGESIIILSNNRAHCLLLGRMLWERDIHAFSLIAQGKSKRAQLHRAMTIQGMRDGRVRVIIATSLLDEGISIDRLSRVLLALPLKAKGGTQQRSGRAMRVFEGKHPKIIDIVDSRVSTLWNRFQSRLKVYIEMGIVQKE